MAKWNKEKKVLDHEHTKFWRYEVKDVEQPNLQKDVFPYDEVCRIVFDHKLVMMSPAEDIFITDTTFRDGQQARPPYTAEQIADLFKIMSRLGGEKGVIRQTEFFLYTQKRPRSPRGLPQPEPALPGNHRLDPRRERGRPSGQGDGPQGDGHPHFGVPTTTSSSSWVSHASRPWRCISTWCARSSRRASLPGAISRISPGPTSTGSSIPFAIELMKLREQSGIDVKIRLCDTMGYGITYPGAALPRSVDKIVRAFIEDAGVPGHLLEWHGHNDFHKVLVNATTAWLYGCSGANGDPAGHRRAHGKPARRGPHLRVHPASRRKPRDRHDGDHRDRRLLPARDELQDRTQLSLRRLRVQRHAGRYPRSTVS